MKNEELFDGESIVSAEAGFILGCTCTSLDIEDDVEDSEQSQVEVAAEAGFILGCTCTSLDIEDDVEEDGEESDVEVTAEPA